MGKTAIILGSTGLTGGHLLHILLSSNTYDRVISFVRNNTRISHPKLIEHVVDFDNIESFEDLVQGDDLFCCLGTTIKKAGSQKAFEKVDLTYPIHFAKIAVTTGLKQYLSISSIGANPKSNNFYLRTKGTCEEELRKLPFQSTSIFRPSLILGNRKEFRLGERIAKYSMKVFSLFLFGKLRKYKSVEAKDIAYAMFYIAQQNTIGYHIYESDKIIEISESKDNEFKQLTSY